MSEIIRDDYGNFLNTLKERIRSAQVRAALAVNHELILLYWGIGRDILNRQHEQGWGARVIDRLASDLRRDFPEMKGFSSRNLKYMRSFAEAWPDEQIVQQFAAQLPWFHNCTILDKVKNAQERLWYIQRAAENGWSRNILAMQIDTDLYRRQGKAVTNFSQTLLSPRSDLARETLKDPYNFDFLTIGKDAHEREIEKSLMDHMRLFLLELGAGFAFVGNQYRLEVGGDEFYLDLLFYHLKLRCYIVIELKAGEFKPEYAGKMNFYLSAVDDLLRHSDDAPSIGLLLCRTQNRIVAEYALRDVNKPIGISLYDLEKALPREMKSNLPTIEEIEEELTQSDVASASLEE